MTDTKNHMLWRARHLAKMGEVRRNPAEYLLCTPWHAGYALHRRYRREPGFESVADYLELVRNPIDPSLSDTRLDHLDSLDDSLGEMVEHAAALRGATMARPSLNGCTGANHMALEAAVRQHDKIVLATGCHQSIEDWLLIWSYQGLELKLVYVPTAWSANSETFLPPTADEMRATLRDHPDTTLVILTCPTYPGLHPTDLAETISAIRQGAPGARVFIDAAWGTHFGLSPAVPEFPLAGGVDLVTSSDHKTGLAEEQAAMLYVGTDDPELLARVESVYRAITSTSPSNRLLASLDASLVTLASHGERLVEDACAFADAFREEVARIEGLKVMGQADLDADPERFVLDPVKVFVDVSELGYNGRQVYRLLERQGRVVPEMASERGVLFLMTPAYRPRQARDLADRLRGVLAVSKPRPWPQAPPLPPAPQMAMSPASAIGQADEPATVHEARGRVAASAICIYPPGVYVLRPGQHIDEPTASYLERALAEGSGAYVQGLRDGKLLVVSDS